MKLKKAPWRVKGLSVRQPTLELASESGEKKMGVATVQKPPVRQATVKKTPP